MYIEQSKHAAGVTDHSNVSFIYLYDANFTCLHYYYFLQDGNYITCGFTLSSLKIYELTHTYMYMYVYTKTGTSARQYGYSVSKGKHLCPYSTHKVYCIIWVLRKHYRVIKSSRPFPLTVPNIPFALAPTSCSVVWRTPHNYSGQCKIINISFFPVTLFNHHQKFLNSEYCN